MLLPVTRAIKWNYLYQVLVICLGLTGQGGPKGTPNETGDQCFVGHHKYMVLLKTPNSLVVTHREILNLPGNSPSWLAFAGL